MTTLTPTRIQRQRTRCWRMPAGAVYVGRPTKWGNPYRVCPALEGWTVAVPDLDAFLARLGDLPYSGASKREATELAVRWYREALFRIDGRLQVTVDDVRRELRGKTLACWCPLPAPGEPDICHAAVLLAVANGDGAQATDGVEFLVGIPQDVTLTSELSEQCSWESEP